MGAPVLGFAAICFLVFFTSRKRPGETPIGLAMERISMVIARMRLRRAAAGTPA